jgi:superfamily II DNA/RNA helicase
VSDIGITTLWKSQEVIISNHVRGNDLEISGGAAQGRTIAVLVSLVEVVSELVNTSDVEGPHALYIAPTHEQTTKAFDIISILAKDTNLAVCRLTKANTNMEEPNFVCLWDYGIIVSTPGLVLKMEDKSPVLSGVRYMVIDDAYMSLFGQGAAAVHTKNVLNTIRNKHHPDLVTSIISNERLGTFTQYLKSAIHVSMQISDTQAMLSLSYMPITGQRAATIRRTVLEDGESLAGLLSDAGLSAQVTHSMKEMNERLSIIQQFNEGRCRILIIYRIGLSGISLHWVKSVILDRPPERWEDFLAAVHKAGLIAAGKAYVILNCTDHAEVERFQAIMTNFYHIERGAVVAKGIVKSSQHSFGPNVPTTKIIV